MIFDWNGSERCIRSIWMNWLLENSYAYLRCGRWYQENQFPPLLYWKSCLFERTAFRRQHVPRLIYYRSQLLITAQYVNYS